jgi:signal transduction histidine kinase
MLEAVSIVRHQTTARRGGLVVEVPVLVVVGLGDIVLAIVLHPGTGIAQYLLGPGTPTVGVATAVLAGLRRMFPERILMLGLAVAGLSLSGTIATLIVAAVRPGSWSYPGVDEIVAMALLTGAACRRLTGREAGFAALASVVAMVSAPVLRYGIGSPAALMAVPAAVLWGVALAVGLLLRDADRRRMAELADVRANERMQLARELHDLIGYHVSGIVVRAQAAKALAENPAVPALDPVEVYGEIEQAGADALTATRRLVGLLRADGPVAVLPGSGLDEAIRTAVDDHGAVDADLDVDIAAELADLAVPPELAITAHRLVLEALTNVRRHAPDATRVTVRATVDGRHAVVSVHNDKASGGGSSGYGLVGMAERVHALGGSLSAGAERGRGWRLIARLPLEKGSR